jgi:hypothetical protein
MIDRAALGVESRVIEAAEARVCDRAGAHRAGLERHVEVAADKPLGARRRGGFADGENFGVRGRIGPFAGAVSGPGKDDAIARDRRADRRFAARFRRARFGEGDAHRVCRLRVVIRHCLQPLCRWGPACFFVWRLRGFRLRTGASSGQSGSLTATGQP